MLCCHCKRVCICLHCAKMQHRARRTAGVTQARDPSRQIAVSSSHCLGMHEKAIVGKNQWHNYTVNLYVRYHPITTEGILWELGWLRCSLGLFRWCRHVKQQLCSKWSCSGASTKTPNSDFCFPISYGLLQTLPRGISAVPGVIK